MAKDKQTKSVFHLKGARWLLEGGGESLTDDERALLLAMIEVDAENLNERERAAVDKLKAYDTNELAQAVARMVTAKPREDRKVEGPELERKRRKNRSSKK